MVEKEASMAGESVVTAAASSPLELLAHPASVVADGAAYMFSSSCAGLGMENFEVAHVEGGAAPTFLSATLPSSSL